MTDRSPDTPTGPRPDDPGYDTANVHLDQGGRRCEFPVRVALGPRSPLELIPPARQLAEQMTATALEHAKSTGRSISCRAACGACCRQCVSIAPVEAAALADLVEAMPEPRRTEIRRRFAEAVARFERAGLLDVNAPRGSRGLVGGEGKDSTESHMIAGSRYFREGVPCPFLENESCSIYADRPMTCREYHVSTPAELCREIYSAPVRAVIPPVWMARPLARAVARVAGTPAARIPLITALETSEAHGPALRRTYDGLEMFRALLAEIDREHAVPFEQRQAPGPAMQV